tara:strand:+ start:2782 stop:3729 length:948 start_codon:yes stop_codon:yes gene_type:complete
MRDKNFNIIVPCFNEEEVLPETIKILLTELNNLASLNLIEKDSSKIIFIDDGSNDQTWEILSKEIKEHKNISGIKLSRNFGHQNALLAGMLESESDVLITIDADLQDDSSVMADMLRDYHKGKEIVYGVRNDRSADNLFKRKSAVLFYKLFSLLGAKVIFNHADFRLLSRKAITNLRKYNESNLYLRGIIPLLGLPSSTVEYKRFKRNKGKTKYDLTRMIALSLSGITSFSFSPLRFISFLGLIISISSILMIFYIIYLALFTDKAVAGWASTLVSIYFLGGIQLLSLGIIGEYLGKVFNETKQRPNYLIEERLE